VTDPTGQLPAERTLAEVFARMDPKPRYNLGLAASSEVLRKTITQTQVTAFYQGLQPFLDSYARAVRAMQPALDSYIKKYAEAHRVAEQMMSVLNTALREFDGYDWDKLGRSLDATVDPPLVTGKVTIATPTVVADRVRTDTDQTPAPAWWSDVWRARALLAASLYFAVTTSAEFEFQSDLLSKLEAHLVFALAMYGAVLAWGRRQGK